MSNKKENNAENQNEDNIFASGFATWDLLPPAVVVKRVKRKE